MSAAHFTTVVLSEGIIITLQRTYNAVNYRLCQSAQRRRKLQNSKLNRKT